MKKIKISHFYKKKLQCNNVIQLGISHQRIKQKFKSLLRYFHINSKSPTDSHDSQHQQSTHRTHHSIQANTDRLISTIRQHMRTLVQSIRPRAELIKTLDARRH